MGLPFNGYNFGNLVITDEELLDDLAKALKGNAVLEADLAIMPMSVDEKKHGRPLCLKMYLLRDAKSGMVLKF